jgi:serine/threonine protein kinase
MQTGLDPARALTLLSRIAFALAAVHGAGVIHRDLKPDNIILRGGEAPVLIDFGIALLTGKRALPAGTPAYMAPEQARGRAVDERADLYALGVIAYQLLTGERPQPPRPRSRVRAALVASGIDTEIARLIGQLIAPYRILRPRSAALVGNVFADAAKDA